MQYTNVARCEWKFTISPKPAVSTTLLARESTGFWHIMPNISAVVIPPASRPHNGNRQLFNVVVMHSML